MSLQPSLTYVNGDRQLYALASESASNWYTFPSQNGQVLLVDASGTQVLQSIGGDLFYDGELLARAGDIQDIAAWSDYPVTNAGGVNFNGNPLVNASTITATGDISGGGAIYGGSLFVTGGIDTATSGIQTAAITTIGAPVAVGDVKTATVSATGLVSAGSVSATGDISGGSVTTAGVVSAGSVSATGNVAGGSFTTAGTISTGSMSTTGGLDMTNSAITRAASIAISNAGLAPYGVLTSPDGVMLTFNGAQIQTGGGGSAAAWSTFPAISGNVDLSGSTITSGAANPIAITAATNLGLNATAGTVTTTASANIAENAGANYNVTVDQGANVAQAAGINLTAQNGSGGNIVLNSEGGFSVLGQQVGYGAITLNAFGAANQAFALGGKIDLNAYSAGVGDYGGLSSRVSASAATISLSAGAVAALPGLPGSFNVYGQGLVSIVSSIVPPILPQVPESVYLYGLLGVNVESPAGIQMLSDTYAGNVYPRSGGDLVLQGRTLPDGYVRIEDCTNIDMVGTAAISGVATINGSPYPPPAGDASAWATFKAVQSVDMSSNGITNLASINVLDNATITSAGSLGIFSDLSGDLSLAASGGGNVNIGNGGLGNINIVAVDQTTTLSGKIVNITGVEGTTITDPSGVTIVAPFLDLGGADLIDVKNINGDAGLPITVTSSDNILLNAANDVFIDAQTGAATLNGFTGVTINGSTAAIDLVSSTSVNIPTCQLNMTNNKIINLAAGTVSGDAVNYGQLTFRDSTEFYVSGQGSDVSGNGSILAPYLTIQKAITQAELISSAANVCVINVASGHYTENLSFAKGYIILSGSLQSQTGNEVCEITGSISIACAGANDLFNRQVSFQGFNITCGAAQSITDTSTSSHTVSFQDCKMFIDSVFFNSTSTAADMRFYMTNVELSQTNAAFTGALVTTNLGLCEFERLDVNLIGNCSGIVIGGTSVLSRCSLTTLDANNAAAILRPLLTITSSTTSTHSLGNVAFAFTNAAAKTNTNAVYINSSINTAVLMFNCLFTLAGTASSTNNCVGYNGVGSPTIAGVNNTALSVNVLLPQTVTVQSGIAQISYIDINPPGLASYSSTIDQTIAVANTPQALIFNTTQFNQGTTLVANSRVYVNAQGNYALNYIVQLSNSSGASHLATTFLKKNGAIVSNSGSQWTLDNAHELSIAKENIVALNAGDYVEVFLNADALGISANATAATAALPAIPSVVFNIKQFR